MGLTSDPGELERPVVLRLGFPSISVMGLTSDPVRLSRGVWVWCVSVHLCDGADQRPQAMVDARKARIRKVSVHLCDGADQRPDYLPYLINSSEFPSISVMGLTSDPYGLGWAA